MPPKGLIWHNAGPPGMRRAVSMMVLRSMVPVLVRVMLAALLVAGAMGRPSVAAEDHGRIVGVHHAAMTAHDCCSPEQALPDGGCDLVCAQAPCGLTVLPVEGSETTRTDLRTIQWAFAASPLDGIAPETRTPPPRS